MQFKDYYQVLGVDRHADQKTVSRTFRRLARESHPDVNKKKGAEDRFKEINEAYQVLGDPEKRAKYDQIYDAYKSGGVPWQDLFGRVSGAPEGWTGPGGVTFEVGGAEDLGEFFGRGGGFSDFFQQLFGGLGGAGRPAQTAEAPRLESTVEISLEDAFHGGKRQIRVASLGQNFDVEIPKGIRSGQTIRLAGAAGGQDLYLNVQVAPHRFFERGDADLTVEVPITIAEAALGGEIEVPTLDGKVTMTVPAETQTGRRFRLKGLGMPHTRGAGRGDLYVKVKVVTPTGLTQQERTLFEELRRLRAENPRQTLMS